MPKKTDEEIEMSKFFVVRGIKSYPQVFHVPIDWIPKDEKGNLVDKEELIDMGEQFSLRFTELRNQIYFAQKEIKEMEKKVVQKAKRKK